MDADGRLVLLADQDRSLWDRSQIDGGIRLLERAAAGGRPGPYQLEAAISAVHCEAPSWAATDWPQLRCLYDLLVVVDPSPVVRLNRAVVLREIDGPAAALAEVEALAPALGGYHLFHAVRASLLRALGRDAEASAAELTALGRTANRAEQALLGARLRGDPADAEGAQPPAIAPTT